MAQINRRKDSGFTIVELLIVIVVIAILATISIVAYTGIQNRARDTTNKTDAQTLAKIAETVYADTGSYPTGTTSANLTTSMNQSALVSIPAGVAITYLATAGTNPGNAAAITAADGATRTYTVKVCSGGLLVFYPSRDAGALQSFRVGTTTSATAC